MFHRRSLLLSMFSLSLLWGCGDREVLRSGSTSGTTIGADTLKLLSWQAPTILNPHLTVGFKDWEASRITLEPLATFDKAGQMVPVLAADVPTLENGGVAADGRSVTWTLKPNLKWSDGQPFSAKDVVFTYELIVNPETGTTNAGVYETVDRVEAIDDTTVKVYFKEPNPAWSLPFVGAAGSILPAHIFAAYNGANLREAAANLLPIGTGPYRVVEFKPGDVVVYEPNPYYRDAATLAFKRIEIKGGGDATSAARAVLQTGDADLADNLQVEPQVLAPLEAEGRGRVLASFGPLSERLEFNYTDPNQVNGEGIASTLEFPHPFLTAAPIREAISLAIDREMIATQLYGKAGQGTGLALIEPEQYRSPNPEFTFDPDRAIAVLEAAGWTDSNGNGTRDKNGVELQVVFQTSVTPVRQKTQEIIKQALTAIGIGVELRNVDASVLFSGDPSNPDTLQRFPADIQMYTTGNSNPDPAIYMKTFTCGEVSQPDTNWSGQNFSRFCDPAYDQLWEAASRELDPAKRAALFIQMNDRLVDQFVMIPIVHRADVFGISDRLQGVDPTPWDRLTWNIAAWSKTP
ncbi:MAG: peptide ABC transporter substrate-binding protein [Oscillatoriales cyanobacterium]|nr:MAG: peptide ABC transporter substrate-binding protein [Oscillatoriales cyanobacterium]